jgi:hypothetical protein
MSPVRRVARAGLLASVLLTPVAQADADGGGAQGALRVTVVCDQPAAPGRLRCDVEARGRGTLQWADVEVVRVPDFVSALRGRVGPTDATTRESDLWRWSLGLAARNRGEGDVAVRVRAVVCEADVCAPAEAVALGHVKVGS